MLNLRVLEAIEYLDDSKVIVELDGKKYIRVARNSDSGQKVVKINNREYLV